MGGSRRSDDSGGSLRRGYDPGRILMELTHSRLPEYLLHLAEKIPEIACPPGCSVCCNEAWNLTVRDDGTFEAVRFKDRVIRECSALGSGGCDIYDSRPFVCRILFKGVGLGECSMGLRPSFLLTATEIQDILIEWNRLELLNYYAQRNWHGANRK
jgi:Fe-S-cluster containining protein